MKFGVLISYPRVDHDIIELCLLDPRVPIHGPKTHPQAKSVVHLATVGMRKLLFAVIILRDEHVPNYPEKAKSYPPVRVLDGRKSLASEGNHLCDLHREPENHLTRNLVCSGVLTGAPTLLYVNSRGPLPPRGPPVKDFCVLGQIGIAC